jgi:hypothetical protein
MVEKKIDMKVFRQMVKEGKTADEIIKKFKLKTSQSIKSALLNLILEDNKVYNVKGMGREPSATLTFGKHGIHLTSQRLKNFGFKEKDKLTIEKRKETLVMKRVD